MSIKCVENPQSLFFSVRDVISSSQKLYIRIITMLEASPVGEAANLWSSWVMLDDAHTIVPLSREKILYTSPPRISLAIEPPNPYPGKAQFSLHCSSGKAFLTNQRVRLSLDLACLNQADRTRSWFSCQRSPPKI